MKYFTGLKDSLSKASSKMSSGIADIFNKKKLDQQSLGDLEELLIIADLGQKTASDIVKTIGTAKFDKEVTGLEIKEFLVEILVERLQKLEIDLTLSNQPQVILLCGVNGGGKTTTIAKMAKLLKDQGKKVLVAACDTFRAAASDQLQVWVERVGCDIMQASHQSDAASLAYKALERAKNECYDVLLIDTAGRLHTKTNLMDELSKINRVLKKFDDSAPHDVIMVIDATTGQNALAQIEHFAKSIRINKLIINKLDGTAKAGILVAISEKFHIPIYAIGVGEKIDDFQKFDAREFAKNLVGL